MEPEKKIETGLKIESLSESSKITSENDFSTAFEKGLSQRGVGLYDDNISIVRDGNRFVIGPKDGQYVKEYISVDNITLLKNFVYYVTDKHSRKLLSSVYNNFNVEVEQKPVTIEKVPGVKTNQIEEYLIIKEERQELNKLKDDISFQQIIDGVKALTTGGTIIVNGEKKTFKQGQYEELRDLIAKSKPKKDDIIYNQNLKIFSQIIQENKENALNIEKQAKEIKDNNNIQNHQEIIRKQKQELDFISGQYSQIEKYLTDPTLMNKPFDAGIYNTDLAIYSSKDIRNLMKKVGKQDVETKDIDEASFNTALLKLDLNDRQEFRVYLNAVIAGTKDPTKEKYIPKNKEKFEEVARQYPALQGYIDIGTATGSINTGKIIRNEGDIDITDKQLQKRIKNDPKYAGYKEAFEKGGVAGIMSYIMDKTNMREEQKQFRGGVGQVAMIGGMIFVGWKMISSAFKLITGADKGDKAKQRKNRARLYMPAAIVFGAQAWSGQGPLGLLTGGPLSEKAAGLFGGKKTSGETGNGSNGETIPLTEKEKQMNTVYEKGYLGLTSIFSGTEENPVTYKDIVAITEQKDGKIKIKPDARIALMEKFSDKNPNTEERNPIGYEFLNSIGAKDPGNMVDMTLHAMGIDRATLNDANNAKNTFAETASGSIVRLGSVYAFMNDRGYKRINPASMEKIQRYIANPTGTIADLEQMEKDGDVFLTGETMEKDRTGLEARIREIANGDKAREETLTIGLNQFYDYMPNGPKNIELIGTRPQIEFKTYGQSTKIDLEKKYVVGFDATRFPTLFELFKVANLTNRIRYICKDKEGLDKKPFYVNVLGNLAFNKAEILSKDFDDQVLSAGRFGKLEDISPTLDASKVMKEAYVEYLNTMDRKVKPAEVEKLDTLPNNVVNEINTEVGNRPEKAEILLGLKRFYTNRPNGPRDLDVRIKRPKMQFRTYGQQIVTVDLAGKFLDGFGGKLADYEDVFKAANLTNYIRMRTFDKPPRSGDGSPFKLNTLNNITFNDGMLFDTKIMGTGRFSSLREVSPALDTYKISYVEYLNKLRDKTGLRNKVRDFVDGNDQREADITSALNLFYEYMPNSERKIDINPIDLMGKELHWPTLNFTTYGENTPINMESMGIVGFSACHFDSYLEAFKAANLTNKIKQIFKNRRAGDFPFNISMFGRDIEFDRNTTLEKGAPRLKGIRDVEAVSAGRRGSLGEISPKLEEFKKEYVEYLNGLKFRDYHPNIPDYFFEPNPNNPH